MYTCAMRLHAVVAFVVASAACGRPTPDSAPSPSQSLGGDANPTGDADASLPGDQTERISGDEASAGDTESPEDVVTPASCYPEEPDPSRPSPNYTPWAPVVGTHCSGTNHQDISDIERVVFLGDSVTVGTPPTEAPDFYRSKLAKRLATHFGLSAPDSLWQQVNPFDGRSVRRSSGDFWSCAEWGARADDLLPGGEQLSSCFPPETFDQRTLVIMTVGGNDLQHLRGGFDEGRSHQELWDETQEFVRQVGETVAWLTDPERFPRGNAVIMTNLYEYTDGTGRVTSCPAAAAAGYDDIEDPALPEMVVWAMDHMVETAVAYQIDLVFLLEAFCGHGFLRDDPTARCYNPGAELWFDLTCIHPTPAGHAQIAQMFFDVVEQ